MRTLHGYESSEGTFSRSIESLNISIFIESRYERFSDLSVYQSFSGSIDNFLTQCGCNYTYVFVINNMFRSVGKLIDSFGTIGQYRIHVFRVGNYSRHDRYPLYFSRVLLSRSPYSYTTVRGSDIINSFSRHFQCIVQSYLLWLHDNDYNPVCTLCSGQLSDGDCVRLTCYHMYHWACLDRYARNQPATTAPAGYTCPVCGVCIFPQPKLVSPVADVLREKLAAVNWARAGLGLPLVGILNQCVSTQVGKRVLCTVHAACL